MIALVLSLAAALQIPPGGDLAAEAEAAGRLGVASETCDQLGYPVDELAAEDVANRLSARAEAAGWPRDAIAQAITSGVDRERSALPFALPLEDLPPDELPLHAASLAAKAKRYCRTLDETHPGVILDRAAGERTIDDRLAAALRR